ncbi:MAG: FAD-binding protein [Slackia sp.]|nr:FAD-binding protein [Slackia sp.]
MGTELTRRNFLTGAVAAAGVVGCAPKGTASAPVADAPKTLVGQTPAWLGEAPEIAESDIVKTEETGLLIVGAGNGGIVAAATASDLGLDFIIVEKTGALAVTRGWYGAVNIPECAAAGKEVDTIRLNNTIRQSYCGKNDMRVVKVWIDESAEMHEYVKSIMESYGYAVNFDSDQGHGHGGVGIDMYVPPIQVNYMAREDCPEENKELDRNHIFEDYINKAGHEVVYNYDLAKLVQDDSGAVTGAIFDTPDGYVQVNAKNVLLTTGGYASNPDMLSSLNPLMTHCLTASDALPGNTGMGIKAGMWAGAMRDAEPMAMVFDRGAVVPGTKAGYTPESIEAGEPSFTSPSNGQFNPGSQPFLKVNTHGERFFNEDANYDWAPHAAACQPGGVYIEVWDANFAEDVERFHSLGCAGLTRLIVGMAGMDAMLQEWIDKGVVIKADTLEELADGLLLEGEYKENFLASVERYNELYDMGEDVDFGKEAYMLSSIRKAPYYGVTLGGIILSTGDGLRINTDMQVYNTDGQVIPGLYAAGDCSGSIFADGYYNLTHGMACGRTLTFARHAVRHIAGDLD